MPSKSARRLKAQGIEYERWAMAANARNASMTSEQRKTERQANLRKTKTRKLDRSNPRRDR